eukprot:365973-Chlamydomonas_euryale.AAC.4
MAYSRHPLVNFGDGPSPEREPALQLMRADPTSEAMTCSSVVAEQHSCQGCFKPEPAPGLIHTLCPHTYTAHDHTSQYRPNKIAGLRRDRQSPTHLPPTFKQWPSCRTEQLCCTAS